MGIVALVVLSVTAAWSFVFGGLRPTQADVMPKRYYWVETGRALSRLRAYQPPDRKAMIVDTDGMSHRTADGTQLTKRDRSRPYLKLDIQPQTIESPMPAPAPSGPGAPLFQTRIEEIPLAPAAVPKPLTAPERDLSIGRRVQVALLADKSLSRSLQLTLNVTSTKDRVTLRGIVLDKEEKEYAGAKAAQVAGAGNVDNRLTIL